MLREKWGHTSRCQDLVPLAKKLRTFLLQGLKKVALEHLNDTSGERWLQIASCLDPRFKKVEYSDAQAKQKTRDAILSLTLFCSDEHPRLPDLKRRMESNRATVAGAGAAAAASSAEKQSKKRRRRIVKPKTNTSDPAVMLPGVGLGYGL